MARPASLDRALELFEGPPFDPLGVAWVLTLRGIRLEFGGHLPEARLALEGAVAMATDHDVIHVLGSALANLGLLEAREGRVEEGRALTSEAVELNRTLGDTFQLIETLSARSHAELLAGAVDASAGYLIETLRLCAATGTSMVSYDLMLAAELLLRRHDPVGAAHAYQLARRDWSDDEAWFQQMSRYFLADADAFNALPASHLPVPSSVRQRVEWAADRLSSN